VTVKDVQNKYPDKPLNFKILMTTIQHMAITHHKTVISLR